MQSGLRILLSSQFVASILFFVLPRQVNAAGCGPLCAPGHPGCGECCTNATDGSCDCELTPPGGCGGAPQTCTNGTCDSTSCGWNGNGNCNDFGWHDGCNAAPAGCYGTVLVNQDGMKEFVKADTALWTTVPATGATRLTTTRVCARGRGVTGPRGRTIPVLTPVV